MDQDRAPLIGELVEQHYQMLYRFAYRLSGSASDAEDLTQQAFLKAQQKLDQLREPRHARSWLCTILRNSYLKNLRRHNSTQSVSIETVAEPVSAAKVADPLEQDELQQALNELPEEFRTPLILFYFGEFSYKQISEQMDIPVGTVMSRLARGKSQLRRRLAAEEPVTSKP